MSYEDEHADVDYDFTEPTDITSQPLNTPMLVVFRGAVTSAVVFNHSLRAMIRGYGPVRLMQMWLATGYTALAGLLPRRLLPYNT